MADQLQVTNQSLSSLEVTISDCIELVPQGQNPNIYLKLIKNHLMKPDKNGNERGVTDLMLFLYTANRLNLDPLARQIYPVFRWDGNQNKEIMSIQTGIDGYRAIAERTGHYLGSDDAVYEVKDGLPTKATVTVYKANPITGEKVAVTASARFTEYNQPKNPMWQRMPYNQLAKCAEALALRKAFPADLSGVYTDVEMDQANNAPELPAPTKEVTKPVTPAPKVTDLLPSKQ